MPRSAAGRNAMLLGFREIVFKDGSRVRIASNDFMLDTEDPYDKGGGKGTSNLTFGTLTHIMSSDSPGQPAGPDPITATVEARDDLRMYLMLKPTDGSARVPLRVLTVVHLPWRQEPEAACIRAPPRASSSRTNNRGGPLMKRSNVPVIAGAVGLALAAGIALLGVVMTTNANFARTYVRDQLSQQRITFKTVDALTPAEKASPCLRRYAGQRLTTGKQAECYANDFIGLHVKSIAGGQTYAELGDPERALTAKVAEAEKAGDPTLPGMQKQLAAMRGVRGTLFQGETSRGLLLTSFGFSDLGTKAGQAATVAYTAAALVGLASLAGFARGLRAPRRKAATVHPPAGVTVDGRPFAT